MAGIVRQITGGWASYVSSVVAGRAVVAGCVAVLMGAAPLRAVEDPRPPQRPAFPVLPAPPEVTGLAGLSSVVPEGRSRFLPLLTSEARARGLPPEVADAVARVESGYNSGALGSSGERGMMQVMPPTAAMLGFKGTLDQLAEPATNIRLGVTYLAEAWRLAGGDLCRALMKYRAGHNQEQMSPLSVEYCRRAKSHLAALGSPLGAGALPAATLGGAPSGRVGATAGMRKVAGRLVRGRASGQRFWAAHTARIKAIEARLPWKHGGIMAGT